MPKRKTLSCSNWGNEGMNLEPKIPFDIIIEILTRVPAKSVARFRCISKLLYSNLTSCPNFKKLFLIISLSRPKLLFICQKHGKTSFLLSSSQQNHKNSRSIEANFQMNIPITCKWEVSRPSYGLVCGLHQKTLHGSIVTVPFICNPSTGKHLILPKVRTRKRKVQSFLGYDPIGNQFKVLCMIQRLVGSPYFQEHQVLTLGTDDQEKRSSSWRMVECDIIHETGYDERSVYKAICINGVLYYLTYLSNSQSGCVMSFDIRSERFKSIRGDEGMIKNYAECMETTLINYKGKLAMIQPHIVVVNYYKISTGIQLWILENGEQHQWSSHSYIMNPNLEGVFVRGMLRFVGTTDGGEIMLSSCKVSDDSYYLLYYNPERNSMRRVNVRGMEAFRSYKAYTFIDHVENVKFV